MKNSLRAITLKLHIDSDIEIKSYQNELSQVILIILQNAIEAIKESGVTHNVITVTTYEDKNRVSIEIEDSASGINPEYLERIFEPYFSTKKENAGTGLGLYIAKIIMERSLKGRISVSNRENGAVFKLTLPT